MDHLITAVGVYMDQGYVVERALYTKWWSSYALIDMALPDDPADIARNIERRKPSVPKPSIIIVRKDGTRYTIPGPIRELMGEEWVRGTIAKEQELDKATAAAPGMAASEPSE